MASPFDLLRVEWLEDLNVKRYKLASHSFMMTLGLESLINPSLPLLGIGLRTIHRLISFQSANSKYLYCISSYPTQPYELSFSNINFTNISGFSDHTIGLYASFISISWASIIEKHFTLDKTLYGPDHSWHGPF